MPFFCGTGVGTLHLPKSANPLAEIFLCSSWLRLNERADEMCKRHNILFDAGLLQTGHVFLTPLHRHDNPGIAARHQLAIHCKASRAPIPVHKRMDVNEEEMPQNGTNKGIWFLLHQRGQSHHRIQDSVRIERNMHGIADIHLVCPVADKVRSFDDASPDVTSCGFCTMPAEARQEITAGRIIESMESANSSRPIERKAPATLPARVVWPPSIAVVITGDTSLMIDRHVRASRAFLR